MSKQSIEKLYRCIEKENYAAFSKILKEVRAGNVFDLSDLDRLCDVFCIEWSHIEPFQYRDIQRMIILSINYGDKNLGMTILANKLNEIAQKQPIHIKSFLNFLINSYTYDDLDILAKNLHNQDKKNIFADKLVLLKDTEDIEKINKIDRMLEIIQRN